MDHVRNDDIRQQLAERICGAGEQKERSLEETSRRAQWIDNRDGNEWSCIYQGEDQEAKKQWSDAYTDCCQDLDFCSPRLLSNGISK